MTYKRTISKKANYLHAIVTGQNSLGNIKRYLHQLYHECKSVNCSRLLIEKRLEGPRLNALEVFETASEESRRSTGMLKAVAYVDINAEGDLMKFAETVAVNRAVPMKIFSTLAEAEKWLTDPDRHSTYRWVSADAFG
jgi:hypothetical protein